LIFCTESTTLNPSKGHLLQQWKQKVTSMFRNHHRSQEPYLLKHPKNHRRHLISCEKPGHTTPPGTCKLYFLHTTDLASKKTGSPWRSSWLLIIFIMNKDSKSSKNAELEEHIRYNLDWSIPEDNFRNFHSKQNPKNWWQFGRKLPASAKGVFCKQLLLLKKIPFQLPLPENRHWHRWKGEPQREWEKRGSQGEGTKTSKNIAIHTLRHFFSSFRFFLPETERGPVFTDTLREGGADLRRRFSDRLALLSFWMLRKGRLNLFILPSSSCRSCRYSSSSFSSPPSVPPRNFSNFEFREQIAKVLLRASSLARSLARFVTFFFLQRLQRPKPNG